MTHTTPATLSLDEHWMPFTANRAFKRDPILMVRAEGMYYWNQQGDKILDACSGLFCVAAGHNRPEIREAVARQLGELDYTPHFQLGFPGSFELARQVTELTPEGIDRVFFTNSGSESVETALKIALAYHRARGDGHRNRFVGRERAYHGMNFGGLAVGGIARNRQAFSTGLPNVVHLRHTWLPENRFTQGLPDEGAYLADDLERFVEIHGDTIAACIVEPISGSSGVLVPPKGYLHRLRDICDRSGILLIFDEVITGFGRLGHPFAAQAFDVTPDIITMAKALTNGCMPLGAVAVKNQIHQAVVESGAEGGIEFFHGYTYSGSPGPVAAGLAALEIYRREALFARADQMSPVFLDALFSLQDIPAVTDIRGYGMLGGVDLEPHGAPGSVGSEVFARLYKSGVLVKATGDALLIAPPLVAERTHIEFAVDRIREVLSSL